MSEIKRYEVWANGFYMNESDDGEWVRHSDHLSAIKAAKVEVDLRYVFAAKAMQGLLANPGGPIQANGINGWNFTNCSLNDVAELSYQLADAMLKERSKDRGGE